MKFKYYIGFGILFIIIIGIYVYTLDSGNYPVSMPNQTLNLPVALWVVIIILIFFILSLIFFLGEWVRGIFTKFNNNKDFNKIIDQIISQNTQKNFETHSFKNERYSLLSKIIARFDLVPNLDSPKSSHYKIDKLFEGYSQINQGNEVDVRKFQLDEDNEFFIKNAQNKMQKDLKFCLDVLRGSLKVKLKKYAFLEIVQKGNEKDIQKALDLSKSFFDKNMFKELFKTYSKNKINLNNDDMSNLCKNVQYNESDYLNLAKESKNFFSPDEWLKIFGFFADKDENAEKSYLYVLLELEMIDLVNERLSRYPKNQFLIINAYLDLKKIGKNYPLDEFFM